MSTIAAGDPLPPFALPADGGATVNHEDLRGTAYVLYLYPKDDTSGCTAESLDFARLHGAFEELGVLVFGLSKDDVASHDRFKAKHGLPFKLLSDATGGLVERLGAWVEKSMYGRRHMGIERTTFLVDGEGRVRRVWRKVKVPGHAEEVLAEAEKVAKGQP